MKPIDPYKKRYYYPTGLNYRQHFRKTESGQIRWTLEVDGTGEIVAHGIAGTLDDARASLMAALELDRRKRLGEPRDPLPFSAVGTSGSADPELPDE